MTTQPQSPYRRRVFYYETDRMGIVHHANYIRWMEEARLDFMGKAGLSYREMEAQGIIMPVVSVDCRYITSLHFDEEFEVRTRLTAFNGVRAAYSYGIYRAADGVLAAEGESSHCFLNETRRNPVSLKKAYPAFYEKSMLLLRESKS